MRHYVGWGWLGVVGLCYLAATGHLCEPPVTCLGPRTPTVPQAWWETRIARYLRHHERLPLISIHQFHLWVYQTTTKTAGTSTDTATDTCMLRATGTDTSCAVMTFNTATPVESTYSASGTATVAAMGNDEATAGGPKADPVSRSP